MIYMPEESHPLARRPCLDVRVESLAKCKKGRGRLGSTFACNEGVSICTGVGDGTSELAVLGDDNAVRAGRAYEMMVSQLSFSKYRGTATTTAISSRTRGTQTSSVDTATDDGELLEGTGEALELELLPVVVAVGVAGAAGGVAVLEVSASSVSSVGDLAGAVVGAAAGGLLVAAVQLAGGGADGGGEGEDDGGDGELHLD
jgi:hypothetical protein